MNILQIVVKTIVTTLNIVILSVVLMDKKNSETVKRVLLTIIAANLMGVWI